MRPGGISKSSPCRISLRPNFLRRPRAETIGSMISGWLARESSFMGRPLGVNCTGEKGLEIEVEGLDLGGNARPVLFEELFALMSEQLGPRSGFDEHSQSPSFLHHADIDQCL